jgi:hypothetical protein
MNRIAGWAVLCAAFAGGCGYRVGSGADLLPKDLKTIAVPAFGNNTTRYKLTERLPSAISRELISRTRYRVVADTGEADAILLGTISNVMSGPTIVDQASGRAAGIQIYVFMNLTLTDRRTGQVLYTRQGLEVRQRYEVSIEQTPYFDESEAALDRLSKEVARQVVSSLLEAF